MKIILVQLQPKKDLEMKLFDYLKNIFFILILLQFAPALIENIKKQYGNFLEPKTKVGVLSIKGVLYNSETYAKHLHKFFKNNDIKAILIKMECPGSAAGTGQAIFNEILSLKKEFPKPIIVLVENLCASGGYYIACAADTIIAPSSAIIGSIGTYLPYTFKLKDFIEQYKIHYVPIKAGKYKAMTDPFVDFTVEDKALLQNLLNDSYQQFTIDVAKARKLSLNTASEWADGKIFTARQGLKLGLIDQLGSAYNAIKIIKEKAIIDGEIEWVHPKTETGVFARLFGAKGQDDENSIFTVLANNVCTFLENRYLTQRIN